MILHKNIRPSIDTAFVPDRINGLPADLSRSWQVCRAPLHLATRFHYPTEWVAQTFPSRVSNRFLGLENIHISIADRQTLPSFCLSFPSHPPSQSLRCSRSHLVNDPNVNLTLPVPDLPTSGWFPRAHFCAKRKQRFGTPLGEKVCKLQPTKSGRMPARKKKMRSQNNNNISLFLPPSLPPHQHRGHFRALCAWRGLGY